VPETQGRAKVIEVHTEDKPLAKDVNTDWLARETDGYVGADIEALLREAALIATRDLISGADHQDELDTTTAEITEQHLEQALDEVGPSVTPEVREQYEEIEENFQQSSVEEQSEDDRRGGAFR
jgi:transitional endoplasmic reticulum ATPase